MNRILFFFLLLVAGLHLHANNIEVTDIVLTNQNAGAETTNIQFDLSWENSWRVSVGPSNYDAAWVIAKYRVGGGPWRHAELAGFTAAPAGAIVEQVDRTGLFVYRAMDDSGNVSFQDIEVTWDYGADNVDPNAVVDVQVFALEMVYVPKGEFRLGTGFGGIGAENEVGEFRTRGAVFPTFYSPYLVTSDGAITVGNATGQLDYDINEGGSRSMSSLTLSGEALLVLYGGGGGDGFDFTSMSQALSGESLAQLFGGGEGDGFDAQVVSVIVSGETLDQLFGGGDGDGFDAALNDNAGHRAEPR